jgi:ATP-dependent exoDNAse (exonuclease V) beta subunit
MPLKILSASAGSGKTYRLSREYVRLCLEQDQPGYAGSILAMTFTNKATQEMKERILRLLMNLARREEAIGERDVLYPVYSALGAAETARRADAVLHYLLKNYHFFSVSTIDSFFQGIIRQFQRELSLDFPVEVELDQEAVLDASIRRLFERLDAQPELLSWFNGWVREKIKDGGDWDVRKDLRKLGFQLFQEGVSDHWQDAVPLEELSRIQEALRKFCRDIDDNYEANQKAVAELLRKADLASDHFSYGSSSFVAMWLKFPFSDLEDKPRFLNAGTAKDSWFARNQDKAVVSRAGTILDDLELRLNQVYAMMEKDLPIYKSYKAVLSHFSTYVALRFLYDALKQYCSDNDKILLSEANKMVAQVVEQSDLSLLYEKSGQRYKHLLVDEFQDTSGSQWTNLRPLYEQTLSEGKFDLIVGDIKQAIYRWRNGNWEIMHRRVEEELGAAGELSREALPFNFRSAPAIIDFNNRLFEQAVQWIDARFRDDLLPEVRVLLDQLPLIYHDVKQDFPEKSRDIPGLVRVFSMLADEAEDTAEDDEDGLDKPEDRLLYNWLSARLRDAFTRGFTPGDVGILVRTGNQETKVLQWIHRIQQTEDLPFPLQAASEKGLRLAGNAAVELLVHLLACRMAPEDRSSLPQIHYFFGLLNHPAESEFLPDDPGPVPWLERALAHPMATLSQWFVQVIEMLALQAKSPLYVSRFLDHVRAFELKSGADLAAFLVWWEANKLKLGVSAEDNDHAVKVMTIHKSKGLQFPVVLIPFSDAKLNENKSDSLIYVQHPEDPILEKLGVFPVTLSDKKLANTPFHKDFQREMVLKLIDALNLLYVATTRAEQVLDVAVISKSKEGKTVNLGELIMHSLSVNPIGNTDTFVFGDDRTRKQSQMGKAGERNPIYITKLNYRSTPVRAGSWSDKELPGAAEGAAGAMALGTLVHEALSRLTSVNELEIVLTRMQAEGLLWDAAQTEQIRSKLKHFLDIPEVHAWFNPEVKVYAEREIIEVNGKSYRPDRVVIGSSGVEVIDFKTGKPAARYSRQITQYAHLIQKMGLHPVSASIAYIDNLTIHSIEIPENL